MQLAEDLISCRCPIHSLRSSCPFGSRSLGEANGSCSYNRFGNPYSPFWSSRAPRRADVAYLTDNLTDNVCRDLIFRSTAQTHKR